MSFRGGLVSKVEGGTIDTITNRVGTAIEVRPDLSLEYIEETVSTSIAAGASNLDVTHSPPAGFIDRLVALEFRAEPPNSSGSGTHGPQIILRRSSDGSEIVLARAKSDHNTVVQFRQSNWDVANNVLEPSDAAAMNQILSGLTIDENTAFAIRQRNDADVAQDTQRTYKFMVARQQIS